MTDKLGNLLSPDRNNETEESKCCKQLGSEALTLKIFSELMERMVSLNFDSDWKVKTKTSLALNKERTREIKISKCMCLFVKNNPRSN